MTYFFIIIQIEQISQLTTFVESLLEYHQQCTEILRLAVMEIREKYVKLLNPKMLEHFITAIKLLLIYYYRRDQAASRPKLEFVPKTLNDLHPVDVIVDDINGKI